jgi:hypothetical protein
MKKLFNLILLSSFLTIIFFSCNKDTAVNPGGGTTGPVTQSFTSSPTLNKVISNTQPVLDTISANITDNILSNSISDIKITLGDVESVEVDKIQFSILHGSTEVIVIDYLTKTGVGSFMHTVLWDSANTPIDSGQSPYTSTYKPQHSLSNFISSDPAGQWIIKITYSGSVKSGVIKSWGITITYNKVQTPTTQIFPTAVGNYWILEERDSANMLIKNDTFNLPYSTTLNGKTVYRWYMSTNTDTFYVWNESDGLWTYSHGVSYLGWKYPVNPGEWWLRGGINDTVFCLAINETFVTPFGTYTGCIKYKQPDHYNSYVTFGYLWMKPGLGIVAYDFYDNNSNINKRMRLISYHLNK